MVRLGEAVANREVAGAALTVLRAIGVLAAEAAEVVRGHESSWSGPSWRVGSWTTSLPIGIIPCNQHRTPPGFERFNRTCPGAAGLIIAAHHHAELR